MPDDITTDLAAIGAALDAGPTPGEWYQGWHGHDIRQGEKPDDYGQIVSDSAGLFVSEARRRPLNEPCTEFANAAYIAACHPARMARILADHARLTAERDRLAAEVEALRAELGVYTGQVPSHVYQGLCPDPQQPESIDAECPACRLIDAARTAKEG